MTGHTSPVRTHLRVLLVSLSVTALVVALLPIPSSAAGAAANLDQCVNGGVGGATEPCLNGTLSGTKYANWVNGDANGSKAHWREGDYVSYRVTVTGLVAGSDHKLTFHYDTVHGSKHAIDFLGSFDATETTSLTQSTFNFNHNNPCADTLGCSLTTQAIPISTAAILAPTLANCNGSAGTAPAFPGGSFAIFGPAGSTVSTNSYPSENAIAGTGQCSTTVLLPFHVGTGSSVVLAWGGHIASQKDWGAGNSASAISGSPYHMFLDLLDTSSTGAQDRALSTTSIIFTPTISTILSASTINVGQSVTDSATLAGASSNAGGTVTYTVYSNNTCTTAATTGVSGQINAQPPAVTVTNGAVPNSASVTFNLAGTYYFQASYSGDSNNIGPVLSTCTSETVVVGKNSPTLATTLHDETAATSGTTLNATIGDVVHDSASLTGAAAGPAAGATIGYAFYTDAGCTLNASDQTPTINTFTSPGPIPDSKSVTFLNAGTFYWQAVYSGDANNKAATSPCNEILVVTSPPPSSQITPTNTTCAQFASGTAATLAQIQYSLKGGTISQVDPGVFFYWVQVPTAGTYTITQTISETSRPFVIWPGTAVWNNFDSVAMTCTKVNSTITQNPVTGTVTVTFSGGSGPFFIGIKYKTSSVVGENAPSPSPTVKYTFTTIGVINSTSEIDLVSKF